MEHEKRHPEHSVYYKRVCGIVDPQHYFYVNDGQVVKSLADLHKVLGKMTDQTYHTHLSHLKNDYASWVRDVVGDQPLARELKKIHNRKIAQAAVNYRLVWLTEKVNAKKT